MVEFADDNLVEAAEGLGAMAHPLRLAVLCHLAEGPKNVSELLALTGVLQPNLSQHLSKMRALGIVHCERRGQHNYYSLSNPMFLHIVEALKEIYCPVKNN